MQRKTRRIILAVALVGALAIGGAAFTDAVQFNGNPDVAGYGSTSVTGGTLTSVINNLNNAHTEITSVDLTFGQAHDPTKEAVTAQFGDETGWDTCADQNPGTDTQYRCTITNGGGTGGDEVTSGATSFAVTVVNT